MLPTFTNSALLEEALTHRSALNEIAHQSNERLEFLGDAVLELATTIFLYQKYPEANEGLLTSYRASLVRRVMLAEVATTLGLGERLIMSKGEEAMGGRKNPALLENAFEALVGALYQDQGFAPVYEFLESNLFVHVDEVIANNLHRDFKSTLQELIQSQSRPTPHYHTVKESGPDHDKTFTVEVKVEDETLGSGEGKSKQEASQMAAKSALEKIGQS